MTKYNSGLVVAHVHTTTWSRWQETKRGKIYLYVTII